MTQRSDKSHYSTCFDDRIGLLKCVSIHGIVHNRRTQFFPTVVSTFTSFYVITFPVYAMCKDLWSYHWVFFEFSHVLVSTASDIGRQHALAGFVLEKDPIKGTILKVFVRWIFFFFFFFTLNLIYLFLSEKNTVDVFERYVFLSFFFVIESVLLTQTIVFVCDIVGTGVTVDTEH